MKPPAWWFGAPLIAGAYVALTPRVLPDLLPESADTAPIRWLVGLLLGVAILLAWQLTRWMLASRQRP